MKGTIRITLAAVTGALLLSSNALADITIDAGSTIIGQQSSKQNSSINKDMLVSVDLVIDADIGPGRLHLYVEGSTAPDVSANSVVAGSNHDAGSAVGSSGKGRLQLSELAYFMDLKPLHLAVGVLDLPNFADMTQISNDEASQFLATELVNNTTIPFPDYTPALVVSGGDEEGINATALLANAYGLGDNASANYSDLFKFGRDANSGLQKGLFALAEVRSHGARDYTLGAWLRSSELPRHLGGGNKSSSFGLYATADGELAKATLWSARLGWNSAKATDETVAHASLAVEHAYREDHTIALGVAWDGLSSDFKTAVANSANPVVAELYYRWQINKYVAVSPDIQFWSHANGLSQSGAGVVGGNAWVYGLRIQIGASHKQKIRSGGSHQNL